MALIIKNLQKFYEENHRGECHRCGISIDEKEIYCKECSDDLEKEVMKTYYD